MQNELTVSCGSFGQVGTLKSHGDSFVFKPSPRAVKVGRVPGSGMIQDFRRAALYLTSEPAAVSLRCNGYEIAK